MSTADDNVGIPARLRAARLRQGLEIDALARELKNPLPVLEAIERGEWSRLGAPVFARHLVGRYASRLGVSVDLEDVVQTLEAPVLRSQVPTARLGRFADFSARQAAYIGGTLLVVPLVYGLLNMTATGPVDVRPLDPTPIASVAPVSTAPPSSVGPAAPNVPVDASAAAPTVDLATAGEAAGVTSAVDGSAAPVTTGVVATPTPVVASLAGVAPVGRQIELRFSGDSWIEVFARDGRTVERTLARSGDSRIFAVADVGRVTIGNVDATEVLVDGSGVNLEPVRAANVARFALSSDGSIEAVAR